MHLHRTHTARNHFPCVRDNIRGSCLYLVEASYFHSDQALICKWPSCIGLFRQDIPSTSQRNPNNGSVAATAQTNPSRRTVLSQAQALRRVADGGDAIFHSGNRPPGRSAASSSGVNESVAADAQRNTDPDVDEDDLDETHNDSDAATPRTPKYRCPKDQLKFANSCKEKFGRNKPWIFHPPQHGLVADGKLSDYYMGTVILW
jgi:hypothetical protein